MIIQKKDNMAQAGGVISLIGILIDKNIVAGNVKYD